MKYIRVLILSLFFLPVCGMAATNEFMVAAQLLAAARNADIAQVEALVNTGADVNFVDSTGLSIVCTALMNNDVRAAQILQMYGADASKCDQQIKKYNNRNKKERSGGLFSGLSSAHTLTLAAAGAAVVVGGLLLLTDVFDSGGGHSGSGGGDRPNNNNGGGNTPGGTAKAAFAVGYGPAMPNAASESANYAKNLDYYSPSVDGVLKNNFALMNKFAGGQNYMLMMHGYSPLARGYLGMRTLRGNGNVPVSAEELGKIKIKDLIVGGGRPVGVAVITTNGINAAMKPKGDDSAQKNSLDDRLLAWTTISGDVVNVNPEISNLSSKYYNNSVVLGQTDDTRITESYTMEDKTLVADFDLSGSGTAVQNGAAGDMDNMIAKIIGGSDTGYPADSPDYFGFMPNGQMGIFRTGGARGFINLGADDTPNTGTFVRAGDTFADNDTITLFGHTLKLTFSGNAFVATDTTDDAVKYNGYIGADGALYIADTAGGAINQVYAANSQNGTLTQTKKAGDIDYYNYRALLTAAALSRTDVAGGRSRMDILANSAVIAPLRVRTAKTVEAVLNNSTQENFTSLVNEYYDVNKTDGAGGANSLPGADAVNFFGNLGSLWQPLVIFSAGSSQTDSGWSDVVQEATFENAAPLVFNNLEHLFMSVVAVGMTGQTGTSDTKSVSGYSPTGKIAISQWRDNNGTPDNPDDDKYFKGRVCGIAGKGTKGIDPWCFAAAGVTDELAVASAAGAAGAVKSAFDYMNNKQVFALLALTADGPYLGTLTDGTVLTRDALIAHLQAMYQLPDNYQYKWEHGDAEYLDVFKEVFGYGLINLERATKPGTSVYYYDGSNNKIVSASGNAYWRAATNTRFRTSGAFNPRAAKISAPFFDVLESVDGGMRLPRIWENEFEIGAGARRGLYLGDVFDDLKTTAFAPAETQIGSIRFAMSASSRAYADNMGGVDMIRLGLERGNWDMTAQYQHKFTDGARVFSGMANPIMAMASDAVSADTRYNMGDWSVGARLFSGAITDSELLENDPTITSQYSPARLGLMQGGSAVAGWSRGAIMLDASIGVARETETVLGAQTGGLLNLGGADTTYVDVFGRYDFGHDVSVSGRATFARTTANPSGEYIIGLTDMESDAFALGMNIGNFEFVASRPLAVRRGDMQYAHAEYDLVETDDGNFDISVANSGIKTLGLRPEHRELRLSGAYRHHFGEFTDGAVGFIYRVNPNNTDEFGNETVLMMKLSHRVGI